MGDNKDTLPTLDAKIVSDIVDAVMTSIKADSKVSLKDLPSQTENDDHGLSDEEVAELFDLINASGGADQFHNLPLHQKIAAETTIRAAYYLGLDDGEDLRIALDEAERKVAQLEESVTRPREDPKEEKKRHDRLQSEAWKSAVEWVRHHGTESVDLRKMELANPFDPNKFPPAEHGTVIASSDDYMVIQTTDRLEFFTLTYVESKDVWVGVDTDDEEIWYVDTEDIRPGTWKVVE